MKLANCASALALLASFTSAHAAVIDFEGVSGPTGANVTPYTQYGYTLNSSGDPAIYHNDIFSPGTANTDGTNVFGWCGNYCVGIDTLTLTGPSAFNLSSIDFSGLQTGTSGTYDVTGYFSGGGSISSTVSYTGVWNTYSFSGFNNLSSLTIVGNTAGAEGGSSFAMDNIVVNSVPEPASLGLLGIGLLGVRFARKRK